MKHCDHLHWRVLSCCGPKLDKDLTAGVFYIEEGCLVIERYKLCPFLL